MKGIEMKIKILIKNFDSTLFNLSKDIADTTRIIEDMLFIRNEVKE